MKPRKASKHAMGTRTKYRELLLTSMLTCLRAFSFIVPPMTVRLLSSPVSSWTAVQQGGRLDHDQTRGPVRCCSTKKRLAAPEFHSNEAVSYYHNPDSASKIWLVGVVHDASKSSQLVETVIRKVKPQAVMVEVDPFRVKLLPPGESVEDSNGLWWWSPMQEPDQPIRFEDGGQAEYDGQDASQNPGKGSSACISGGCAAIAGRRGFPCSCNILPTTAASARAASTAAVDWGTAALVRRGRALDDLDTVHTELGVARTRILDASKETKHRLAMAERADVEDARSPQKEQMEKAAAARITRRGFEGAPPAVWRKMRDLQKSWGARKFAVLVTERDEVMASNLLKLERNQSAVAVIGAHHAVGIGNILAANGWKTRRK